MVLGEVEETITSTEVDDETYEEIIKVGPCVVWQPPQQLCSDSVLQQQTGGSTSSKGLAPVMCIFLHTLRSVGGCVPPSCAHQSMATAAVPACGHLLCHQRLQLSLQQGLLRPQHA
jgi:hypothetical protein